MSSVRDLIQEGRRRLGRLPGADAALESRLLLQKAAGLSAREILSSPERLVPPGRARSYLALVEKRRSRIPLAYLIGEREFWSSRFRVVPGVLIPRPETELVVEKVIELSSGRDESIVDVGTGCGAIAVALAGELASARILAVDVSRRALRAARFNAASLPAGRIRFVEGNAPAVFKALLAPDSQDFIVSNPPYVSEREWASLMPEIRLFEPKRALVAGPTGLEFIRKLVPSAAVYLKPGGRLVVEIGRGQKDGVLELLEERWVEVRAFSDLAGIPRVIAARKR